MFVSMRGACSPKLYSTWTRPNQHWRRCYSNKIPAPSPLINARSTSVKSSISRIKPASHCRELQVASIEIMMIALVVLLHHDSMRLTGRFHELTRRTVGEDHDESLLAIMSKINISEIKEGKKQILEAACRDQWWTHPVFSKNNYPYYALELVKDEQLGINDFAAIMCYWSATLGAPVKRQIFPIPLEDLQNPGKPNPCLVDAIQLQLVDGNRLAISKQSLMKCLQGMVDTRGPFEGTLFAIAHHHEDFYDEALWMDNRDLIYVLKQNGMYNIGTFTRACLREVRPPDECDKAYPYLMVPSLTLIDAILNTIFNGGHIKLNPVIGLSTLKDLRRGILKGIRDIAVPFPGFCYNFADGRDSIMPFGFTHHDLYHTYIASFLQNHIQAIVEIAMALRDKATKAQGQDKWFFYHVAADLIDMEHPVYRRLHPLYLENDGEHTPDLAFWHTLAYTLEDISWDANVNSSLIHQVEYCIIDTIFLNEAVWKTKYGISLDIVVALSNNAELSEPYDDNKFNRMASYILTKRHRVKPE